MCGYLNGNMMDRTRGQPNRSAYVSLEPGITIMISQRGGSARQCVFPVCAPGDPWPDPARLLALRST